MANCIVAESSLTRTRMYLLKICTDSCHEVMGFSKFDSVCKFG